MSKKLLTELRSFAETTSVRGIPRVMKAKTRVTFVVWTVGVLTCAALLLWQLSVVLTRYFQYSVSTLTIQAPAWQTPTFPDITICNLDPTIYAIDVTKMDSEEVIKSFSYAANESPIIEYDYFDWRDYELRLFQVISGTWDPIHYTCFTLRPQDKDRGLIRGFSAVMYVDQSNIIPADVEGTTLWFSFATGLRVLVHTPGTAPDMSLGINIGPAIATNIKLTQSVRTRLGQPYSNCTHQQHLTGDNTSGVYTQQYCVNTCIQQKFIDQCGCVSSNVSQYTMAQLQHVNFSVCENVNNADRNLVHACTISDQNDSVEAACNGECFLPCSEIQYGITQNFAPWPRATVLSNFSNKYLSQSRFLHLFNMSANATWDEINAATETPAAIEFFKSNFLQLNVQFGSQFFVELQDVAAFSVDAMGAQIGGVLSLWLGVTVMFAFEVFELICVYLENCRKGEPSPKEPASVEITPISQALPTESECTRM